jgi:hypothetical protein
VPLARKRSGLPDRLTAVLAVVLVPGLWTVRTSSWVAGLLVGTVPRFQFAPVDQSPEVVLVQMKEGSEVASLRLVPALCLARLLTPSLSGSAISACCR